MILDPGARVGHYEILAPLGAGGMGEVYRARDTRLKRDVALKVLPDAFANDPGRMARFQREAEVLASLNHANIAHIYGVEEHALVMELVEGESPRGPMPFDEAWHIASQIAAALEYAHDKGRASRSETRQFEGRAGGRGQAARFRLGEGVQRNPGHLQRRPGGLADADDECNGGGSHPRHCRVYGARTGQRQTSR